MSTLNIGLVSTIGTLDRPSEDRLQAELNFRSAGVQGLVGLLLRMRVHVPVQGGLWVSIPRLLSTPMGKQYILFGLNGNVMGSQKKHNKSIPQQPRYRDVPLWLGPRSTPNSRPWTLCV